MSTTLDLRIAITRYLGVIFQHRSNKIKINGSALLLLAFIGCVCPIEQQRESSDSGAGSAPVVAGAPSLRSNSTVQEPLPPLELLPRPPGSEFFPPEIGAIEYMGAVDDFRELLVSPEKIALWKAKGVSVFYGYDPRTRVQMREGHQVVVTNGMILWNVVDTVYVSRLASTHPVRLFGRNKIIETRVRRFGGKVEMPIGEGDDCAVVEPGDIIMMMPRRQ